jgi:hypothetical protein
LALRLLRVLWLAAVIASLGLGVKELRTRIALRPRVPFTARATSDAFLATLSPDRPARAVARALASLPADAAVVFAGPASDPSFTQILFMVSYLALPRQVGGLYCSEKGGPSYALVPLDADQRVSAVLFFRQPPTAPAETILPGLSLLRLPAHAPFPWTSLCSSLPPPSF